MDTVAMVPAQSYSRANRPTFVRRGGSNVVPWPGAATSPRTGVPPEAVDYFYDANARSTVRSWRAAVNLALVAGGRCVVTMGLGGVLQSFVPGALDAHRPAAAMPGMPGHLGRHLYHPWILAAGTAGAALGFGCHLWGVLRFFRDTCKINRKRAYLTGSGAAIGAALLAAGSVQYAYGVVDQNPQAPWEALPIRMVGNFLIFACLPAGFSASELVHGQIPVDARILTRDLAMAIGGACLLLSTQIAIPCPPAPLWAREIAQVTGILGVALGSALPRVDTLNAQAQARANLRHSAQN